MSEDQTTAGTGSCRPVATATESALSEDVKQYLTESPMRSALGQYPRAQSSYINATTLCAATRLISEQEHNKKTASKCTPRGGTSPASEPQSS